MNDLKIRNFKYSDVDDFIRISKLSFAEETLASGITPEDFEQETRRIFRWKMIPYRLLTALIGIKWEGFVAEKDGKVVGGGMYVGRNNRMSITNLMVDPEYRRQGIGQALLVRRLERMTERGFPFAMAQVLETNKASLQNLRKQNFEVFNQYSVYEHALPLPKPIDSSMPSISAREINRSDRALFQEIERKTTPRSVLSVKGSAETQYFLSGWQSMYASFARYARWIKAVDVSGETIGFLCSGFQGRQQKGLLIQPIIAEDCLDFIPAMLNKAGTWLEQSGRKSMIVEIPDQWEKIRNYLRENGWKKQYTWLELVRWLDERVK
ncbi:MAG: GNAT family N-acetyltransferase [Anaerolineaceae bacterium]|nr:GNAT family N-acetyltransferase [Anaerolineaceae bacterium]